MELRPEEVSKRIPQLVVGASRLYALFATYRTVSGIKPGTTQPKPGLLIDVRSGITSELVIPEGYQFLAVCYTNLTAFFQQTLKSAVRMKSRVPGSKVVLVTHDCDMGGKRFYLQPHLDNGEIDMLIVTHYHGGEKTMRNILDALVNSWPGTSAA